MRSIAGEPAERTDGIRQWLTGVIRRSGLHLNSGSSKDAISPEQNQRDANPVTLITLAARKPPRRNVQSVEKR